MWNADSGMSDHADDAWIAVALSRVDVTTGCGNNPPPRHAYAVSTRTPAASIGNGNGVNPWRSMPGGTTLSAVNASTVGPAPEMAARDAPLAQRIDQIGRFRVGRASVALVQAILGGGQQQLGALGEGQHAECGAAAGEGRVDQRHPIGQQPSRGAGRATPLPRRTRPDGCPDARRGVQRGTGPRYSLASPMRRRTRRAGWPPRCRRGLPYRPSTCSIVSRSSAVSRPASTAAATAPPTAAAAELPSPRECGMALRQRIRRPGGASPVMAHIVRIARTTRCPSSQGTRPAPSPSTSTATPSDATDTSMSS